MVVAAAGMAGLTPCKSRRRRVWLGVGVNGNVSSRAEGEVGNKILYNCFTYVFKPRRIHNSDILQFRNFVDMCRDLLCSLIGRLPEHRKLQHHRPATCYTPKRRDVASISVQVEDGRTYSRAISLLNAVPAESDQMDSGWEVGSGVHAPIRSRTSVSGEL